MSALVAALDYRAALARGENGSLEHKTTGADLLDLFAKLVRGMPADALKDGVEKVKASAATPAELADLVLLAWQTRATRNLGKGERELFYQMVELLPVEAVLATVHLVPHYGCWKDMFELLARPLDGAIKAKIVELVKEQLNADEAALDAATPGGEAPKLSLLGKWAPREGSSYDRKAKLASLIATAMFGANKPAAQRKYRQLVAKLNAALGTTEVLMAANRWAEIQFSGVASLCLQRHRKAFLNEALKGTLSAAEEATGNRLPDDAGRVAARQNLRAQLTAKGGVKGKELGPHELAAKCMAGRRGLSTLESDLMDGQWAALKGGVVEALAAAAAARDAAVAEAAAAAGEGGLASVASLKAALPKHVDLGKLVPLVDVSGSMTGRPMEAAIGLGLLVAELTHEAFRDRCLTFESTPQWVDLRGCTSLAEKVGRVQGAEWGGSTDFVAACELILAAAEKAKLKPDEVPDLIVFSDMQFDQAGGGYGGYGYGYGGYGHGRREPQAWETHFDRLSRRFAEVGEAVCGEAYAPPRIVFWNLRGDTRGHPVDKDAPNAQLLSGFSPALLKQVLTGADMVGDEKEVVQPDGTVKLVREGPTPAETLRKVLDDDAFDPVRLALTKVDKGPLAGYTFERDGFDLVEAAVEPAESES